MKTQIVIIICVALFSIGLAFVRISQNQHQTNDQSQKTIVNTVTKTVVVNISGKKYKNIKWEQEFGNYKEMFVFFNNELNEWQKETSKVFMYDVGYYCILYPTINETPIVYTNGTTVTNNSSTMNTNTYEVSNPILKKIKRRKQVLSPVCRQMAGKLKKSLPG